MTAKRFKVLIVDDNDLTRSVLRMILQGDAYNVVGDASNGKTGIAMALELRPDIVCLDVEMPDYDGLAVLTDLLKAMPGVAVLMVTAHNDSATVVDAVKRGARGFIIKPFNAGTVLENMLNLTEKMHVKK